jgi:alcohol dehydrogenase class IV
VREAVEASFRKCGTALNQAHVIVKPQGEPDDDMVSRGAAFLGTHRFTKVVGIGGGSVMDWCRLSWAVSAGFLSLESGRINRDDHAANRPTFWLAPTTCATGAEAASVAVMTRQGRKVPVTSHAFVADHVVLDGQFLSGLARHDLACYLSDALSHAVEGYISIVPSTLAKQAAVSALRLILDHWDDAPSSHRDQSLMEAAYLGGVAASNCSVGVVHALAHTLASYGISHAAGNAAGLVAGIETNAGAPALQDLAASCGLTSADALAARIAPIVTEGLAPADALAIRQILQDRERRRDVAERMSRDVCLRSNPVPLDANGIDAFLTRVERVA